MSREADLQRRIDKLERINAALIQRIDRLDASHSSIYSLNQARAVLEKEVVARNRDLERTLAELSAINRELGQAREAAEEANRAKSRFLRAASHDLLQPLSAAKLFVSHLGDLLRDPHQLEVVRSIEANFESAEELIHALLDMARLDSRQLVVKPAPTSLGRLFQRLAVDMAPEARSRGLDLRFVASSATVMSDPVYLRRVAQNLISNALKYTERGRVLVGARRDGAAVWLEVHDTGAGIAPEDQVRIFNEFVRLPGSDQAGTGLGLSIVERACRQLGHAVEVRSTPGEGSCFRVRLQPVAVPAVVLAPAAVPRLPGESVLADRSVLVVEDDPQMRRSFAFVLQSWGMRVMDAGSTGDALDVLARSKLCPDIILTDFDLTGGDTGVAAITAVRAAMAAQVPALIVTGERAAVGAQAADLRATVLEKPVGEAILRAAMQALLPGRAA